jgi:hypothetical protein
MLLGVRLRFRMLFAEVVYSAVDWVSPTDRDRDPNPPERGDEVKTKTLQLLHLVRHRADSKAFAARCRTPVLRLWSLGCDVNVADEPGSTTRLIEFGNGKLCR